MFRKLEMLNFPNIKFLFDESKIITIIDLDEVMPNYSNYYQNLSDDGGPVTFDL